MQIHSSGLNIAFLLAMQQLVRETVVLKKEFDRRAEPRIMPGFEGDEAIGDMNKILHAQSFNSFWKNLLPEKYYPKYVKDFYNIIVEQWHKEGYIGFNEVAKNFLELELKEIEKDPEVVKNTMKAFTKIIDESYKAIEPLSGGLHRHMNAIEICWHHLYGIETGRPVAYMLGDVKNMGGANLALGEDTVDKAVRLLNEELKVILGFHIERKNKENGTKGTPLESKASIGRYGGDEFRGIVRHFDVKELQELFGNELNPKLFEFAASLGLLDILPAPRKGENLPGVGMIWDVVALDKGFNPANAIEQMGEKIKEIKDMQGTIASGGSPYWVTDWRIHKQKALILQNKINDALDKLGITTKEAEDIRLKMTKETNLTAKQKNK